ncbi:hypothetical protein HUK80_06635 [Flavobacterium sp. MAH-1]|uniref:Transmembrane protein n=1 Tax=Flavobacterium agri TaxID=2743471 RepID=A0A7Y8Y2A7_9FLAO|nr:hypothetical protein [Flavobacterium agri]NUY80564.1 hypothetical protein [Flavobacterium agri]NYA70588.1 hypothetical protein [Flavobacterium agri]
MKKVLPAFSYLFHPIFVSVYATLLYFLLDLNAYNTSQKYLILLQISIITVFIPICIFFLLRSLGKIDSIMLSELSQRKIPLFIQCLLLYILITKSITIDAIPELFFFFAGAAISSLLAFALSFLKIKASLHMLGISALTAFVVGLSFHNQVNALLIVVGLVALNGFVATSRLEMKAHTGSELAIGFCCGLIPQIVLWYCWL